MAFILYPDGSPPPREDYKAISTLWGIVEEWETDDGIPKRFRLYDLRHTCATLLLSRNVHPKYVQELLGHASITLTLDTYSYVIPGMDGGAASAMNEALG